jgi:hypothetical protein
MNDEHVLTFVEAIDGADLDAIGVFALDAFFIDDVGHGSVPACFLFALDAAAELLMSDMGDASQMP